MEYGYGSYSNYRAMVKKIHNGSPTKDIVLMAVTPQTKSVGSSAKAKIKAYNKNVVKKTAQNLSCASYYNLYSDFAYLKSKYSGGDGTHWNMTGYSRYRSIAVKHDKTH